MTEVNEVNESILKDCKKLVEITNQAASELSVGEFTLMMSVSNMNTQYVHNSDSDPGFYLDLLDQLRSSELVQNPTPEMVKIGLALLYVDKMQYVGPVVEFNMLLGLDEWTANNAYPIYDVICQDDELCPQPTIAFRVVGKVDGGIVQVIPLNLDWVMVQPKATDFKQSGKNGIKGVKKQEIKKQEGNKTNVKSKNNKSNRKVTH